MNHSPEQKNRRILIVDDTREIHESFREILTPALGATAALDDKEKALFGRPAAPVRQTRFEIDSAYQGQEGAAMMERAVEKGRPYAMAFVDMQMPPGWDGLETIQRIWAIDPDIQIVVCTAYADYSWHEMFDKLGQRDGLLILKKPFDTVEALQLAHALTEKWWLQQQSRRRMEELEKMVAERTRELQQTNHALRTEVAEHQRAEETLRESDEKFRQIASSINEVFWITDSSRNQMHYVSPAYEKIWGRTCASLYASPRAWLEAIHLDDRARIFNAAETKQARGDFDETYRIIRPDGAVRWIHDRAFPVRNPAGEVYRMVGTAEDITEQRQLEDQMRQSQKMEAFGQLASGVAHDFNNILAVILGNTELALADTAPGHPAHESLAEIERASARAKSLVQQILAFSRQQPRERRVIALEPIAREAVRFLRATIPAAVELVTSFDDAAPPVLADPTQMHQILVNLCTNAWHALEDQPGRIEIKIQSLTLEAAPASQLAGLRPGRFACLSVSDTGKGIDAATLERIFEPFFTTKEVGKGTGLGLSVVHGIVQEHEGAITVTSRPGRGTTFQVYFPAAAASVSVAAATAPALQRGAGQHILYLDDEAPLVFLSTRMLELLGYRVTGFTRAADAMKAFRENPGQFDLVITDLNMPGLSGLRVAADLLQLRSGVPIVLCSGHVTEELRQQAQQAGIRHVLYKPNTMEEFSEAIHRLLTETRPR